MYPIKSLKLLDAMFMLWVLLLVCLQLVSSRRGTNGSTSCIERERRALLELKKGLVDEYGILSSWGQHGDSDCCNWWGVECSNQTGHVQKLDLHAPDFGQTLTGEISASLVELQHFNYLDLSLNDFHGKSIPEFISSLTNLQWLNLSWASFGGKIPYQLGQLSNLQTLFLPRNCLVGEIPWQLGNLSKLRQLSLCYNYLGGTIPYQLGNLSNLCMLDLGQNDNLQIDIQSLGNIQWISRLSSLKGLFLGSVSNLRKPKDWLQAIGQLPKLKALHLANCSLSSMDLPLGLPSQFNFSNSLIFLDLSYNKLTSSIFPWLFNLNSSIAYLSLHANLLEGPFPNGLGRIMNSLQVLVLSNNHLKGPIPKTVSNLLDLRQFDVSRNSLEGEITNLVYFANLTKLFFLNLAQNSLTLKFSDFWIPRFRLMGLSFQSCVLGPTFPKWLQTQNDLYYLDVSNTGISDTKMMTSFLCFGKESLNFLNISSNHFKGQLPDCWNYLKSLRVIDLSNNEFSGNIPNSMGSLLLVRLLSIYNNYFIGKIPSLKNCTNLVMLDMGRNELFGAIPPWLGSNLPKLQVLNLRNNHFFGSIPLNLCHATTIQILDLSINNLSGQIPRCLQKFSAMSQEPIFTKSLDELLVFVNGYPTYIFGYNVCPTVRWKGTELSFKDNKRLLKLIDLSNNQLSGEIPIEIGNLLELNSLDLSSNNLSGQIPWELGNLQNALEYLNLSANHLSGTIPSSLSKIDRLAVLDLSNNNLSGKIPSGTQLQGFNAAVYGENPYLCGSPLKRPCGYEKVSRSPLMLEKHEEEKDDSIFTQGFYISMSLGFVTGFWAIFWSLLISRSWRIAYFTFLKNLYERIVVVSIIDLVRCRGLLKR